MISKKKALVNLFSSEEISKQAGENIRVSIILLYWKTWHGIQR